MLKHIPNILTMLRFILIPPIVISIAHEKFIIAVIFLIISGLTDVLDGTIARKFNFITDFGKLMDPFADKATQVAILVTLAVKAIIPFWILAVVVVKEFAMISRRFVSLWKRISSF
jgi:cardiolipin synthase